MSIQLVTSLGLYTNLGDYELKTGLEFGENMLTFSLKTLC